MATIPSQVLLMLCKYIFFGYTESIQHTCSFLGCCYNEITFFFFLKFLADTHVLFWGHWYPCFGFLVMSLLGFKAEANVMYIPWDLPLMLHMSTSSPPASLPVLSPHTVAEVRLPGFELMLSEYLWVRRSTKWAKPGPTVYYEMT